MNFKRFHIFLCVGTISLLLFAAYISANEKKTYNLEKSIEIAKENNLSIQSVKEKLETAKSQITAARAAMLPRLIANGNYTYFRDVQKSVIQAEGGFGFPIPGEDMDDTDSSDPDNEADLIELEFGAQHNIQGTVSLSQPVFAWGRYYYGYQAAKINYSAAEHELTTANEKLRLDVSSAFYGVLIAQEFVGVAEQSVKLVETQLEIAQTAFEAGTATNFDILRTKVQLSIAKSQLIRAKNGVEKAKNLYKTFLNFPLFEDIEVEGTFEIVQVDIQLDDLIIKALENRSEVKRSLLNEESGKKQLDIAKTRNLPDLAFFSNYQISHNERLTEMNRIWSLGLQVNIPIFDGFASKAVVNQSQAVLKQIQFAAEQIRLTVEVEVRKAYLNLQEAKSLIDTQFDTVNQAEESVRIATLQFENGMITTVEMTDTQLALMQARVNRLQAYHDYVVGLAILEKAIGQKFE